MTCRRACDTYIYIHTCIHTYIYIHTCHVVHVCNSTSNMKLHIHIHDEHSPISMAIFYERVPYAPYIWNSLKMTVEWLHNRCYIKKESLLSFQNVCCSTFELCFRKKNIFSSYYNTIMIFFFGNSSAKSTFKILAQNNSPAEICPDNSSLKNVR